MHEDEHVLYSKAWQDRLKEMSLLRSVSPPLRSAGTFGRIAKQVPTVPLSNLSSKSTRTAYVYYLSTSSNQSCPCTVKITNRPLMKTLPSRRDDLMGAPPGALCSTAVDWWTLVEVDSGCAGNCALGTVVCVRHPRVAGGWPGLHR